MGGGWFAFAVVACIVLCTGFILAVTVLKATWNQKEREALTSADLRALEESALYLVEQLKSEADHATEELESRCAKLSQLIKAADDRIRELQELEDSLKNADFSIVPGGVSSVTDSMPMPEMDPRTRQVLDLASSGMDCAEIAKQTGMDCAEVKLMLRLAGVKAA